MFEDNFEELESYTIYGDLDLSSKILEYNGNILITGSVKDGVKIVVNGNIRILKYVYDAEIIAFNDIVIDKGIIGSGETYIKTNGRILTKFVENATLEALDNITVKDRVFNSHLYSSGIIKVLGKAGIKGGEVFATQGIETTTIGSSYGINTNIKVGVDSLCINLIKDLELEIDKQKKNINLINLKLQKLSNSKIDKNIELLLNLKKKQINSNLTELKIQKQKLLIRSKSKFDAFIKISNNLYPKSHITFKDKEIIIEDIENNIIFFEDDGEIKKISQGE